eukprot:1160705-Pelagomonas_calceolata.AAC.16
MHANVNAGTRAAWPLRTAPCCAMRWAGCSCALSLVSCAGYSDAPCLYCMNSRHRWGPCSHAPCACSCSHAPRLLVPAQMLSAPAA